jgi:hypothetical protein
LKQLKSAFLNNEAAVELVKELKKKNQKTRRRRLLRKKAKLRNQA